MIFALKDQHLRFFSSTGNSMSISGIVNNTKCNMVREIKRPDRVSNPVPLNLQSGALVILIEIWLGFILGLTSSNRDKSLPGLIQCTSYQLSYLVLEIKLEIYPLTIDIIFNDTNHVKYKIGKLNSLKSKFKLILLNSSGTSEKLQKFYIVKNTVGVKHKQFSSNSLIN